MTTAPLITIFVRHSPGCKYAGDEFAKQCRCRKHFRYSHNGEQKRKMAGTRSWAEAERLKRELEDQLTGIAPVATAGQDLEGAIKVFIQDKTNQGFTPKLVDKYRRELDRFSAYCNKHGVYTVQRIDQATLTGYASTWAEQYPASLTRSKVRERLIGFLRFCYQAEWITRVPKLSKVAVDQEPTLPLTSAEYEKLLDQTHATFADSSHGPRVRALIQLMRWTGLAIRDALTLKRSEIVEDKARGVFLVVTSRQKTGTHVSVPIPPAVAADILKTANGNPTYLLWSGKGVEESATKNMAKHLATLFDDAGIKGGYMKSHRLRDTFAVDLLEKGVPLEEVSKLLGHESIKTTERSYSQWVKGRQDRLVELVTGTWTKKRKATAP